MFGTFTLEIELGNDVMQSLEDVVDALRETAGKLGRVHHRSDRGRIKDANDNTVNAWELNE